MSAKQEALDDVLKALTKLLKDHNRTFCAISRALEKLDKRVSALEKRPTTHISDITIGEATRQ